MNLLFLRKKNWDVIVVHTQTHKGNLMMKMIISKNGIENSENKNRK